MTSQNILDRLIAMFPEFAASWNSPHNYFRDEDGSFTRCGVFAEFSHYFRDHYEQLPQSEVTVLGGLLTEWVANPDRELRDAVASCFLENVSGERFSTDFRRHLSGEALELYTCGWDNLPSPQ
jgi:hypothetical protein